MFLGDGGHRLEVWDHQVLGLPAGPLLASTGVERECGVLTRLTHAPESPPGHHKMGFSLSA